MTSNSTSREGPATAASPHVWPIVVVGGGAAGLMAALFAARAGAQVLVLESNRRPGTKIRISGGGRCNVLPSEAQLTDFVSSGSPHTLRNMLSAWPLGDVRAFFEDDLGVVLKREATGKLFPVSDRAQDVIDALVSAIARAQGTLRCGARVKHLTALARRAPDGNAPDDGAHFDIGLASGERLRAVRVILATGGLSVPATGSDGSGLRMACALGHSLKPMYPALVPLLAEAPDLSALKGLACSVTLSAQRRGKMLGCIAGDFLFTHRGYSGPAVLNISRHVTAALAHTAQGHATTEDDAVRICVRWPNAHADGADAWPKALKAAPGTMLVGVFVRQHLPKRLADTLVVRAGLEADMRLGDLRRAERQALVQHLESFELPVSGNEGYRTAEVTAGGIGLDEVQVKTFESKKTPNLYIAGEALDVIGALGGYNFLWAWVSGRRAGQAAGLQSAKPDESAGLCVQSPKAQSAA